MEKRKFVVGIVWYGDFGALIETIAYQYFKNTSVRIYSRKKDPDWIKFFSIDDVCKSDVVFVAVPIKHFEKTISNIVDLVSPQTLLVDVCTVKIHPSKILKEYSNKIKYICTHPMFGPYSFAKINNSLNWLRMVLTDHNLDLKFYDEIKFLLQWLGLNILEKTSQQHDKQLAETLFLTHFIGQIVHIGRFERTDIDTLSFGFLMDAVESVRNDEELFIDVFKYNPYCKHVLEKFHHTTDKVVEKLE